MSKKRALRRAAAERTNAEHNPRKTKKAPEPNPVEKNNDPVAESEPAPATPVRRGSPKTASRPSRERSARSRIAIGVLLALGLMLGFWLLFKLPAN